MNQTSGPRVIPMENEHEFGYDARQRRYHGTHPLDPDESWQEYTKKQRIMRTLENQDHVLIHSLFKTDQELKLNEKESVVMKRVGDSFDKCGSSKRAEWELMKAMVQK